MTLRTGVAGWPIAHSLSPLIHGAWIAATGLDATYVAFDPDTPEAFAALVAEGRAGRLRGLNVTAPYKEQALALADDTSDTARQAGSANLLIFDDGRVRAESTDGEGLMAALTEQAPGLFVADRPIVVLGAGGAARAAAAALKHAGADVSVLNRTAERALVLAEELGVRFGDATDLGVAALVVNALSVPPTIDLGVLPDDAVVMDMTYRPLETPFLAAARARGLTGVDGLAMLIGQARPSFQALFSTAPPPIDVRARALAYLGEAA
jgi:shikimate dehydrogenase